jgi:hypothetical protein
MTEDGLAGHGQLGLGLTREDIDRILATVDTAAGEFFEDPEFPAGPSALFYRSLSLPGSRDRIQKLVVTYDPGKCDQVC